MIRYLLGTLLLANFLLFAWYRWIVPVPEPVAAVAAVADVPAIRLVGEAEPPPQPQVASIESPDDAAVSDTGETDAGETASGDVDAGVAETPDESELPEAAATIPPLAAAAGSDDDSTVRLASTGSGLPAPPVATHCVTIGPFRSADEAAQTRETLQVAGYAPQPREVEDVIGSFWWVYLPSAENREAAVENVLRMREAGLNEITIISPGHQEYPNSVSLGIYSTRSSANVRLQQGRDAGFDAQITRRPRRGNVLWLDLELPVGEIVDSQLYRNSPGRIVRLEERDCDAD